MTTATYIKRIGLTDAFFRLLRTGEALGGRDSIGLMTKIARNNLKYLNDYEIECIYAYLKTKPTQ